MGSKSSSLNAKSISPSSNAKKMTWIQKRQNSIVLMFSYLTTTRKVTARTAQNVVLFIGFTSQERFAVDKMVRKDFASHVTFPFGSNVVSPPTQIAFSRCSCVFLNNIYGTQQLYDECDNRSHFGGRPSEVERLVKLGANGSGYKDPWVRLPLVSSF